MPCQLHRIFSPLAALPHSQRIRRQLGAGVFYALCLAAAAWMQDGAVHWQGANAMLPLALLLGGCFGGAAAALKGGR